jgi:hypothetical protein
MSVEEHKKLTLFSCGSSEEHLIFEQCRGPQGQDGYAVFYNMDSEVKFQEFFEDVEETKQYLPLKQCLWPLAKFPNNEYRLTSLIEPQAVFEEVRNYVYAHVELPHEALYDVMALWIMASYLPEKFDSIPYLCFIGPKDSGKTRALEVLWQLAYRSVLSPSFSSAALFRTIEKFNPTLCLDEAEIYGNEQKTEAIAVLNAGYRKGQYILRVNNETSEIDCFSCFGFKGLASTNIFIPTIESRAIIVNMRKNVRDIPLFMDKEKAATLRLMLLLYRFNILRDEEAILNDQDKILGYLPIRHGRIAELFYPLIAVCPSEEIRRKTSEFAKEVYAKRLEEEKASTEAEFVEVLLSLADKVENGKLSIEAITEKFNQGKTEKQQWNPRSIGRWLKRLGFQSTRITKGLRAIFYETELLGYLAKRYGYTPEKTSLTSLMSPTTECIHNGKSDVSDISDVSLRVSPLSLDDLTSVYWKDEALTEKECGVCGYVKPTVWEAVTVKGQVIAICDDCVQAYQKQRG